MVNKRRPRNESGEATAQLVIITPILLIMVFLAIQAALFFHAANVAAAAASQGAAAGSRLHAEAGVAAQAASTTVHELGATEAEAPSVAISATDVVVRVDVSVSQIIPFFPDSVSRTAVESRERFVPEPER